MRRPNPSDRIERVARELKAPAGSSTLFANEEAISKNRRAFVMECPKTWNLAVTMSDQHANRLVAEIEDVYRHCFDSSYQLDPIAWSQVGLPEITKRRDDLVRLLDSDKAHRLVDVALRKIRDKMEQNVQEAIAAKQHQDRFVQAETARRALISTPCAMVRQIPVGHGGFHAGVLDGGEYRVRWIYDCGTWRAKKVLKKRIEELHGYWRREKIDFLFLSHFDADHVNGIKELLTAFEDQIDTVIVPYLNSDDVLCVLGKALVSGRCTADFTDAVVSPVRWFMRLGVRRVIQLRPPRRHRPGDGDDMPPGEPPELPIPKRKRTGTVVVRPPGKTSRGSIAPSGTFFGVTFKRLWADWCFVPFVHPVTIRKKRGFARTFRATIRRHGKGTSFRAGLLNLLKTAEGRKLLKKAYEAHNIGDANAISLSLYEGPHPYSSRPRVSYKRRPHASCQQPGWLLTGDARLEREDRRSKWLNFFNPFKTKVGTLMLPHHGSIHNFHADILEAAWDGAALFVTANADDATRPNREVKREAKRRIHKVSEASKSAAVQISGPPIAKKMRPDFSKW